MCDGSFRNKNELRDKDGRLVMRIALVCGMFVALCCIPFFTDRVAIADNVGNVDKGGAVLVLQSTIDPADPAKPATFPHEAHQGRLECKTCHHSRTAEGKRLSYAEGQKIEKCESCHNSKMEMPEKLSSFKNAAHTLCQGCHRKNNPDLVKCAVCHKK